MRTLNHLQEVDPQNAIIRKYERDHITTETAEFTYEASDTSVYVINETEHMIASCNQFKFKLPTDTGESILKKQRSHYQEIVPKWD